MEKILIPRRLNDTFLLKFTKHKIENLVNTKLERNPKFDSNRIKKILKRIQKELKKNFKRIFKNKCQNKSPNRKWKKDSNQNMESK